MLLFPTFVHNRVVLYDLLKWLRHVVSHILLDTQLKKYSGQGNSGYSIEKIEDYYENVNYRTFVEVGSLILTAGIFK